MRIQRISYGPEAKGKCGTILSHENNTLLILVDGSTIECKDLYWNWVPLDDEAASYLEEVKRAAIPMTSCFTD